MATKKTLGFKTWRESPERVFSNPGDTHRIIYSGKYNDEGLIEIEEVGKEDIQAYIESFAESVDIDNIIARYTQGETDVLGKMQGIYMDTSRIDKNFADLVNKMNSAEEEFEKLPSYVKEMYGNDYVRFICSYEPEKAFINEYGLVDIASEEKVEVNADES